jgi:hypothetical protein
MAAGYDKMPRCPMRCWARLYAEVSITLLRETFKRASSG